MLAVIAVFLSQDANSGSRAFSAHTPRYPPNNRDRFEQGVFGAKKFSLRHPSTVTVSWPEWRSRATSCHSPHHSWGLRLRAVSRTCEARARASPRPRHSMTSPGKRTAEPQFAPDFRMWLPWRFTTWQAQVNMYKHVIAEASSAAPLSKSRKSSKLQPCGKAYLVKPASVTVHLVGLKVGMPGSLRRRVPKNKEHSSQLRMSHPLESALPSPIRESRLKKHQKERLLLVLQRAAEASAH